MKQWSKSKKSRIALGVIAVVLLGIMFIPRWQAAIEASETSKAVGTYPVTDLSFHVASVDTTEAGSLWAVDIDSVHFAIETPTETYTESDFARVAIQLVLEDTLASLKVWRDVDVLRATLNLPLNMFNEQLERQGE